MMDMSMLPPAAPKRRMAVAWLAAESPTVAIMNMKPRKPAMIATRTKKMDMQVSAFMLDGLCIYTFYFLPCF